MKSRKNKKEKRNVERMIDEEMRSRKNEKEKNV